MSLTCRLQNIMKLALCVVSFFICLCSSASNVDRRRLHEGLTASELKPFSSPTGLQAASRGAGQPVG